MNTKAVRDSCGAGPYPDGPRFDTVRMSSDLHAFCSHSRSAVEFTSEDMTEVTVFGTDSRMSAGVYTLPGRAENGHSVRPEAEHAGNNLHRFYPTDYYIIALERIRI